MFALGVYLFRRLKLEIHLTGGEVDVVDGANTVGRRRLRETEGTGSGRVVRDHHVGVDLRVLKKADAFAQTTEAGTGGRQIDGHRAGCRWGLVWSFGRDPHHARDATCDSGEVIRAHDRTLKGRVKNHRLTGQDRGRGAGPHVIAGGGWGTTGAILQPEIA